MKAYEGFCDEFCDEGDEECFADCEAAGHNELKKAGNYELDED